ncbi:hypothetical protein B9Z55_026630 [Caenorhabditis nigoni]|uniref:Uncharacterized protein n=1 Tax=Caenorhabditis nigoni TaxID=1611254 RepID=A0A2G5T3K0_9PELO|nr:hypothetical protein B9Z55_026630 [Caenorhabditis nigoni]
MFYSRSHQVFDAVSSSNDSDSDEEITKKKKQQQEPPPQEEDFADVDDIFVVNRAGGDEASKEGNFQSVDLFGTSYLEPYEMYEDLMELLDKAVVGPKFENNHQPQTRLLGRNALARHKKKVVLSRKSWKLRCCTGDEGCAA